MIYLSSGTGAWEAAIVNRLSPGDKVLMVETGHFAILWPQMAARWGLEVDFIPGDWRRGAAPAAIEAKLAEDGSRAIKAVMVVLTAVLAPSRHDADVFRSVVLETYNMSLGARLAKLAGKVFWIGHLGECNDPILIAALSRVGMGLAAASIPHLTWGMSAGMASLQGRGEVGATL
jgi:aspartate aminotransferase-like enzyme